jgi:hypothetical protein
MKRGPRKSARTKGSVGPGELVLSRVSNFKNRVGIGENDRKKALQQQRTVTRGYFAFCSWREA